MHPSRADSTPPMCHILPKKNPNTKRRHEKPSFEFVDRGYPRDSQSIISVAFGCPPEVNGKSLLLKTAGTLDAGPIGCTVDLI